MQAGKQREAMPAGHLVGPSHTEVQFLERALQGAALRTDGRRLRDARKLQVHFGERLGWCEVHLGDTVVIASVDASLGPPREERPYEGTLTVTTDMTPMAGVEYDANGPGAAGEAREREALFDRLLERAVRRTEALDRESLCIIAGKCVWNIVLTVHLLSDDGAPLDAAVFACMAALRHFRRPDVSMDNGQAVVHPTDERVPVPLAFHHTPLCVTYAVFQVRPESDTQRQLLLAQGRTPARAAGAAMDEDEDEEKASRPDLDVALALLDPSLLEQTVAHSLVTLVLNAQRELCVLDKAGGVALPYKVLLELLHDATERAAALSAQLEKALADDAQSRVVDVQ